MLGENPIVPMLQAWDRLSCYSLVDRVFTWDMSLVPLRLKRA